MGGCSSHDKVVKMKSIEYALERANLVGTMLDEPQLCYLYSLAGAAPYGSAVECGVYKGGSLAVWAAAREFNGPIYAVDTWHAPKWHRARADFDYLMAECGLTVQPIVCNSWEAVDKVRQPIAFVFIDSNHGVDGIPYDVDVWPKAIMPGGIIAFHDYDVQNPTIVVKEYVDKWHKETRWHRLGVVGSTIAFMRPRGAKIGGRK